MKIYFKWTISPNTLKIAHFAFRGTRKEGPEIIKANCEEKNFNCLKKLRANIKAGEILNNSDCLVKS